MFAFAILIFANGTRIREIYIPALYGIACVFTIITQKIFEELIMAPSKKTIVVFLN